MSLTPIESLLEDLKGANARSELAEADVIVGVDVDTKREFTVFGTPPFEESFQVGRPQALRMLRVALNQQAGELEKLVALVKAVKGRPRA